MLGCSCPCSITAAPGFALPRLIPVLSHNDPHQEALMSAINGQGPLIAFGGREERALLGSPVGNVQQPGLSWAGRAMKLK